MVSFLSCMVFLGDALLQGLPLIVLLHLKDGDLATVIRGLLTLIRYRVLARYISLGWVVRGLL